jgi:hypothetical protein
MSIYLGDCDWHASAAPDASPARQVDAMTAGCEKEWGIRHRVVVVSPFVSRHPMFGYAILRNAIFINRRWHTAQL